MTQFDPERIVGEGVAFVLKRLKNRIDLRLDSHLADNMKPGYDDSITGFNEAWDIVRKIFDEEIAKAKAPVNAGNDS